MQPNWGSESNTAATVAATLVDGRANSVMNDDVSREQLDKIKARTMYNMVEPLDGGNKKLLFLTNAQATLLAKEPASMQKMLDRLEVGQPQLVINLLQSRGFGAHQKAYGPTGFSTRRMNWAAGIMNLRSPFLDLEGERMAGARLDVFMRKVLIPLAAETKAVVITGALPALCELSASFLRMVAAQRATWTKLPFTVLSVSSDITELYSNKSLDSYWKDVSRRSHAWMLRDARMNKVFHDCYTNIGREVPNGTFDLDKNLTTLIFVDSTEEKKCAFDPVPFANFVNELTRYLSSRLPSLAIKTGFSGKYKLGDPWPGTLAGASDSAQSGTPTLLLDVRQRPELKPTTDRAALIREALQLFEEESKKYIALGINEAFDVCSAAYFHDVLMGDGCSSTTEFTAKGRKSQSTTGEGILPLHAAIELARSDEIDKDRLFNGVMRPATEQQITETTEKIVDIYFRDAWELLTDEQKEAKGSYDLLFADGIQSLQTTMNILLSSENMYHLNLIDIDGGIKLVNKLVRLDRLPRENPLEGLVLLQSAWRDNDVAMHFAGRYKFWSKFLFALQLFLGWLVVAVSASSTFLFDIPAYFDGLDGNQTAAELVSASKHMKGAVFGISLALSVILALDALTDWKSKWKVLRRGAGVLESAIWSYRSRVGMFEMEELSSSKQRAGRPERALMNTLRAFRDQLLAEAKLGESNFHKMQSRSVYKHFQDYGYPKVGEDDCQSPVQPHRYISLRIMPTVKFYANRIPRSNRCKGFLKLAIVLLSVAGSTLARYQLVSIVVLVTSGSAAVTSWVEFADNGSKAERYTRAISALKNLLDWWGSLTEVQKASREAIGHLVLTGESIIAEEQLGWTSVAGKDNEGTDKLTSESSSSTKGSTKGSAGSGGGVRVVPVSYDDAW